jgi:hypothetical protein
VLVILHRAWLLHHLVLHVDRLLLHHAWLLHHVWLLHHRLLHHAWLLHHARLLHHLVLHHYGLLHHARRLHHHLVLHLRVNLLVMNCLLRINNLHRLLRHHGQLIHGVV